MANEVFHKWQLLLGSYCYYDYEVSSTLWDTEVGWLREHSCLIFAKQNAFKKWERPIWGKWMSEQGRDGNNFGVIWTLVEGRGGHRWGLESDNLGIRARRTRTKETSREGGTAAKWPGSTVRRVPREQVQTPTLEMTLFFEFCLSWLPDHLL